MLPDPLRHLRAVALIIGIGIGIGFYAAQGLAEPGPATVVYLEGGGQAGRGLLIRGPSGCVIVTAAHVLEQKLDMAVRASDGTEWTAKRGGTQADIDIAVAVPLDRSVIPAQICADPVDTEAINRAVQSRAVATLLVAGTGGSVITLPVTVKKSDIGVITFEASDPAFPITQTQSGSPLLIDGVPVAIFTKTTSPAPGSPGVARRIDQIVTLIGKPLLAYGLAPARGTPSLVEANQMLVLARQSRPSADIGQVAALQTLSGAGNAVSALDLAAIGFGGAQLSGLIARDTNFMLSDFSNTSLEKADFRGTNLDFVTLDRADLGAAKLARSAGTMLSAKAARLDGADLTAVGWRVADLSDASLRSARLQGASLSFSDLRRADFRQAVFDDLVLIGSDLRGAKFDQLSARSIDVTGAVFDDTTFPAALKPALCATLTARQGDTGVELIIWEDLKPAPQVKSDIVTLAEEGEDSLALRFRVDRFFPRCPLRTAAVGKDYDAMIDAPTREDPDETVHPRMRVEIPAELLKTPARRDRVVATIKLAVAAARQRNAALDTSNAFYRDRPALLLAELNRNLARATMPSQLWLNDLTLDLLAANRGITAIDADTGIADRFMPEKMKDFVPESRRAHDNWTRLFPAEMVNTELSPTMRSAFGKWASDASRRIPLEIRISVSDTQQTNAPSENRIARSSLDTVLEPYKAALHDGNYARYRARDSDCITATMGRLFPEAERIAAQRRLNYFGSNKDECQWAASAVPDTLHLFGGNWFERRTFLELRTGRGELWMLAVDHAPEDAMLNDQKIMKPAVMTGHISRVVQLPAAGGKTGYSVDESKLQRKIIVLDNVRYTSE